VSQWNLSVQLTGQGSDLATTLRDSAKEAGKLTDRVNDAKRALAELRAEAANPINIRLDIDGDHLRRDVDSALTTAGSGQGITVRLDIDGNHLRDDVQAALTAASSGQSARVRLDIDAAHLRDDVSAALTTAGSGQGITVRLDIDAGHLRDDVDAALTAAGTGQGINVRLGVDGDHLRDEVQAAVTTAGAGQGLGVRLTLTDTMQLRRDVQDAVRWAAWGHRIEIPIGLADPMQLRRDVSAAVRWASMNQTVTVRVVADTSALTTLTHTLSPSGGGGGSDGGFAGALSSLMTLAPAAIPLAAGLAANMAPLAAEFGAAGIAGAAFGIALAGQIGPLSDAADAEKKYQDAVVQHGAASKQAVEASLAYQKQLALLPPETQRTAIALSTLKGNFSDWSNSMAGFTMEPVTNGITVLDTLIPRLTPEVKSASTQLGRLVTVAGGAIATPGFDTLSAKIASFTDGKLDQLTDQVIHFIRVLSEGNVGGGALGAFMDYARQNGPAAREAISAISHAVITLAQGAAQAGPGMLALITAAARLVAALPPELVGIILGVASALKILQLSGAGMAALAGGITRVRTAIAGLTAASAAAGGGLAGLSAAFATLGVAAKASLIVAGVAAVVLVLKGLSDMGKKAPPDVDKLTTSLGNLGQTGKATGEAASVFGKNFGKLQDQIKKVTNPSVVESINNWGASVTGGFLNAGDATEEFTKNADAIDKSLTNLVRGGKADLAKAALADILKGLKPKEAAKLRGELDDYKSALADAKFEQDLATQSMGIFGQASQDTSAKLDAQKQSADGLRASIVALNDANRSAYDAQISFEQAVDDLSESFKKNGATLDLNTDAGRKNGQAMSTAAKSQDEMIASGLAAGESLDSMTTKSSKLRTQMLRLATDAFDGNKKKATEYVNTLLGTPDQIKTIIKLEREKATAGLREVQAEILKTPGAKSIVVSTLNAAAIHALEAVGLKTRQLPDGRTEVYTANGESLGSISAVRRALEALDGKTATTYTTNRVLTVRETRAVYSTVGRPTSGEGGVSKNANGGVWDYYANGGIQRGGIRQFAGGSENHVAQIAPAGSWRVWGEPETQGEGYVPFAASKRPRSRKITEEIVRRLGGDPRAIQWNANGSVTDWRYDPTTGSLYSGSDASQAGHKTKNVKVKVKGKWQTKEVEYFDLGAVEKKLKSISKLTVGWNNDLKTVADRVGGDVADALAGMGEDGMQLARKMAHGSTKYINDMAAALRNLQKTAKASLTDYTRQLSKANVLNKTFSDNLAKLAAEGFGDLASQLAAQNDQAAQDLAAAAVKDKKKAGSANAAAKTANNALTSDQVSELVSIIAAIKNSKTGIHDVAATTSLGEDEIITVATKASGQIKKSLGSRATRFLSDLGKANKHLAYANGGIRAGIYTTRGGAVTFAEPETGGEAYLPLGPNKRRHALPVLSDVAHRFGLGLTDVAATRPVVIVRGDGDTHVSVTAVRTNATASDIGSQVGRSVRRARRGGVAARAAA
jgi:hypothetical protein